MATVAPAGRGHAPFLETLIINQLHFVPVAASSHLSRHLSRHVGRQDTILNSH